MNDEGFDAAAFARAFQDFLERFHAAVPAPESPLRVLLTEHLGADPAGMPALTEQLHVSEHVNVQLALDALHAEEQGWSVVGLPAELLHYHEFSLASLLGGRFRGPRVDACPPEYVNLPVDVDRTHPCARLALHLGHHDGQPLAVLVSQGENGPRPGLRVEVVAVAAVTSGAFLERLRRRMHELDVHRGKVLTFGFSEQGGFGVTFQPLPAITRDSVVLPEPALAAIEQHTVGVSRHAEALRAAGRHLKRGLLLYGPPGTGKTLSVMYLRSQMSGRTTLLLSGPGAGALGQAVAIARSLQPSMVVLEDVDLVAMERTMPGHGSNPLLFQLLNEMDGLGEDADVVFVLTTNRVELLEPALAAWPGRIDQAVEIGLPDEACRRRLLDLYCAGLGYDGAAAEELVERTAGVSAAFIKELARRGALRAAERGGPLAVSGADLAAALDDLLEHSVLRSTLGANPDLAADPQPGPGGGWSPHPSEW